MSIRFLPAIAIGTVAALTTTLSACSSTDSDPFADVPAFTVDPGSVKLLEAGEGDKTVLAYDTAGVEQTTAVEVATGVHQGAVAANKVESAAPEASDTEAQTLQLEVTGAEEQTDIVADGFKMRWYAEPTGQISEIKLLPPEDSTDEEREPLERAMLQILSTMPVFPREEVGEGAKWTATARTTGQTSMRRTTTYTVTKIDGPLVTLALDVEEKPTETELDLGANAGETNSEKLTAEETHTSSQAEITVDLTKPIPVAGQNSATTRVIYAGPNQDFKVVQDVTTTTRYGK